MKKTFFLMICAIVAMLSNIAMAAEFVSWQKSVPANTLQIFQIDTPEVVSDIYFIKAPDGKLTLVDVGEVNTGVPYLIKALEKYRFFNIDQIILTHQHGDHWGGMISLLNDRRFKIGRIYWSPVSYDYVSRVSPSEKGFINLQKRILHLAKMRNVPITAVQIGEYLDLGSGIRVKVIGGAREDIRLDLNCQSIVFRLQYGDFTMLFTGDQGFRQENYIMAAKEAIASDVLKVGHHAGAGSTGPEFLAAVNPKIALATMPEWLYKDQRGRRVVRMLNERKCPFFPSWQSGNIILYTDGKVFGLVKD